MYIQHAKGCTLSLLEHSAVIVTNDWGGTLREVFWISGCTGALVAGLKALRSELPYWVQCLPNGDPMSIKSMILPWARFHPFTFEQSAGNAS